MARLGGQKGYACIFDQVPSKWKQEGCVSFHALEAWLCFGDWDNSTAGGQPQTSLLRRPAPKLRIRATDADRKVSENMMAMWRHLHGREIKCERTAAWPAYDPASDHYLHINEPLQ